MRTRLNCLLVAGALLLGSSAHAAIEGSLHFTTPTGTARPTDIIEVWGTLSLSASSGPLTYDRSNTTAPFGLQSLPEFGHIQYSYSPTDTVKFASYTSSFVVIGRTCVGNFTAGCDEGQYTGEQGSTNWFHLEEPFTMNPGESRNFLLGTFTPTDGTAALDTYMTNGEFWIGIGVRGLNISGDELEAYAVKFSTCPSQGPDCVFSRTVSEVPVPASAWLLGTGLMGLGAMRKRRT